MLMKSVPFEMSSFQQKVFFFPEHAPVRNATWPDFYFFGTITSEEADDTNKRTLDGLLISEYFFRKVDSLQLMPAAVNITARIESNGPATVGTKFDNSRVLPAKLPLFDAVMVDQTSFYAVTDETASYNMGLSWTSNVDWCAIPDESAYADVAPFGITPRQLVNYLSTAQSSQEVMLQNELTMAKEDIFGFRITNNVELMYNDLLEKYCSGDVYCASTVGLCFREESKLLLCDADGRATEEVFVPDSQQLVTNTTLAGTSFYLTPRKDNMCYFAANVMTRMDGQKSNLLDTYNSKKLFVVEPGDPPVFFEPPPEKIVLSAGWKLVTPLSDFVDPEGNKVSVKVNLRNATEFMRYDEKLKALVIEEGATGGGKYNGKYTITVSLAEVVLGAQMPSVDQDI